MTETSDHGRRIARTKYALELAVQRTLASQPKNRYAVAPKAADAAAPTLSKTALKKQKRRVAEAAKATTATAAAGKDSVTFTTHWHGDDADYEFVEVGQGGDDEVPLNQPISRKTMRELAERQFAEQRERERAAHQAARERTEQEKKLAEEEAKRKAEADAEARAAALAEAKRREEEERKAEVEKARTERLWNTRARLDRMDMRLVEVLDDFMQAKRDGHICILNEIGTKYSRPKRIVTAVSFYQRCNRVLRLLREGQCRELLERRGKLKETLDRLESSVMNLESDVKHYTECVNDGLPLHSIYRFLRANLGGGAAAPSKTDAEIAAEGLARCVPELEAERKRRADESKALAAIESEINKTRSDKIKAFRSAFLDMLDSCFVDIDVDDGIPYAFHVAKVMTGTKDARGRRQWVDFARIRTLEFDTYSPYHVFDIEIEKRGMRANAMAPLGLAPASRAWIEAKGQSAAARVRTRGRGRGAAAASAASATETKGEVKMEHSCMTKQVPRTDDEMKAYWAEATTRRTDRYVVTRYRWGERISTMRLTGGQDMFSGTIDDWANLRTARETDVAVARDTIVIYDDETNEQLTPVDPSHPDALAKEVDDFHALNGGASNSDSDDDDDDYYGWGWD